HYDRTGTPKLSHYLIAEIVADSETCVPPNTPSLGLQHRNKLGCQRPICFGVANEDVCHGSSPRPRTGMLLRYPLEPLKLYRFWAGDRYAKRKSITDDRCSTHGAEKAS